MRGNVKVEGSQFADVDGDDDAEVEVARTARAKSVVPRRPGGSGGLENMMVSDCISLILVGNEMKGSTTRGWTSLYTS